MPLPNMITLLCVPKRAQSRLKCPRSNWHKSGFSHAMPSADVAYSQREAPYHIRQAPSGSDSS